MNNLFSYIAKLFNILFFLMIGILATTVSASSTTIKIANGQNAHPEQAPWQGILMLTGVDETGQRQEFTFCSGTIIDKKWILSAAHCFQDADETENLTDKKYQIVVGDPEPLNSRSSSAQTHLISRVIIHPNYNDYTIDSDIALLELETAIDLDACGKNCKILPWNTVNDTNHLENVGTIAQISGWGIMGYINNEAITPSILQYANIQLSQCPDSYRITNNMLCGIGGTVDKIIDTCEGDSGSALVAHANTHPIIIGITSWGDNEQCGVYEGFPGVYTRVSQFDSWIDNTIHPAAVNFDTDGTTGGGSFSTWSIAGLLLLASCRLRRRK